MLINSRHHCPLSLHCSRPKAHIHLLSAELSAVRLALTDLLPSRACFHVHMRKSQRTLVLSTSVSRNYLALAFRACVRACECVYGVGVDKNTYSSWPAPTRISEG